MKETLRRVVSVVEGYSLYKYTRIVGPISKGINGSFAKRTGGN